MQGVQSLGFCVTAVMKDRLRSLAGRKVQGGVRELGVSAISAKEEGHYEASESEKSPQNLPQVLSRDNRSRVQANNIVFFYQTEL